MKTNNLLQPWLIAIDFDGTFLYDSSEYPSYSYNQNDLLVLKRLIDMGHKIAFLTGRSWNSTKAFYESLGIDFVLANYNGTLILNPNDETFLTKKMPLNIHDFRQIVSALPFAPHNIIFEYRDEVKLTNFDDFIVKEYQKTYMQKITSLDLNTQLKEPLAAYLRFKNPFDKEQLLQTLGKQFGDNYKFWFWRSERHDICNLEVNYKDVNKLSAVLHIANYYSIPKENIIAFGDNLNDFELLTNIKYGVAMKNATEKILQATSYQTLTTNNDSGVVNFLQTFFKL